MPKKYNYYPAKIYLKNGVNTPVNALISIVRDENVSNSLVYALPEPSSYKATVPIIVNGGRTSQGLFTGQYVAEKYKIELEWRFLTTSQWATIVQYFSKRKRDDGSSFTGRFIRQFVFFSEVTGTWQNAMFYPGGDFSAGIYLRDKKGNVIGFQGCRLTLIEE